MVVPCRGGAQETGRGVVVCSERGIGWSGPPGSEDRASSSTSLKVERRHLRWHGMRRRGALVGSPSLYRIPAWIAGAVKALEFHGAHGHIFSLYFGVGGVGTNSKFR